MKNRKNELTGRVVMVNPGTFSDPLQRPGQIGKVAGISKVDEDVVTVRFEDGQISAYNTAHLITLSPKKMILDSIIYHQDKLSESGDLKNMLFIYKLISLGRNSEALKLAMEKSNLKFHCTMDCKNFRKIKREQKEYFNKERKHGM